MENAEVVDRTVAFQSTRPRGARPHCIAPVDDDSISFNPRAREGRDQAAAAWLDPIECFNPRAREGRDGLGQLITHIGIVSIHAPARGATGCL